MNGRVSRRAVLKGMGALVIGLRLPLPGCLQAATGGDTLAPNAFVRIDADSTVTVIVKHIEFGQGPLTGLATLVAEELDANWEQVRAELAPANTALYANLFWHLQGTGGSTAIANSYTQMREAGAVARTLLVAAASNQWNVPADEISVRSGVLSHAASGRSGAFGDFVAEAATLPLPESVRLKDPADFSLIGKGRDRVGRLDSRDKTRGLTRFAVDIHEPRLLTVVVVRPPLFGARVKTFDASQALAINGVVAVEVIDSGVAVYAESTWPALKARELVQVEWDNSDAVTVSSDEIFDRFVALADKPGVPVAGHGDITAGFEGADVIIERDYRFPYLCHAPMETLDGVMHWDGDSARARYGSQVPTADQGAIAEVFGIDPGQVGIEVMTSGGSFGRRSQSTAAFARELAQVALAYGTGRPVKLLWTREDDIQGGFYRPMFVHRMRGAIRDGRIVAWHNRLVGESFVLGTPWEGLSFHDGVDHLMVEGAAAIPYGIEHFALDAHIANTGVPGLQWRSVAHSHTGYAVECLVDELLEESGQDPVEGRLRLMGDAPRLAGTLRAVAKLSDWGRYQPPAGRALGVAAVTSFGSHVAQIAEVSMTDSGEPRVHKVWCAVDCGVAVNPDIIRAQMEGGIGFGLGHALYGEITLDSGRVQQSNFHDYRSLRISEMPAVEVEIVPSTEPPTGVGEPGVPPIAPAVANALARLGRARSTQLPMVRR